MWAGRRCAHVELFIQMLEHACPDKFVIVAKRHLNHINSEFQVHYNRERPHEAMGQSPPVMEYCPLPDEGRKASDVV